MISHRQEKKTWVYLFTATGGVLLLAIAAFTVVSLATLRQTAYRQTEKNLKQFGYAVANFLDAYPDIREPAALQEFSRHFGAEPEFRVTVIAADGGIIAESNADPSILDNHANRPEVAAALAGEEKAAVRFSETLGKRLVYYAIPYRTMALRLALPVDYIDAAANRMTLVLILSAFIILLMALGVSFLVSSRIVAPLQVLENAARSYSKGILEVEFRHDGIPLELAELSRTFSSMAHALQEKIRALDGQNRETGAILSAMNDALIVLDSDNRVLRINRAAEDLFNISSDDARGMPLLQAVRNTAIIDFAQEKNGPEEERTIEFRTGGADGTRDLLVRSSAIENGSGKLLVFNDITRLKRLERIRKDFVANVSHELKTPVTSIKGFIETLKDGAIDDSKAARRFLDIMDQQSSRLGAIIDDLLTISRLEQNGDATIAKEDTPMRELVSNVENLCAEEARKKETRLEFVCPPGLTVRVNPGLLEQALANLVFNAVKYSPVKSKVTTRIALEKGVGDADGKLVCVVTDNGPGIAEKHLARIFERFYRVDNGRSREQGGTGLGLSIVRHIALAHGGTVSVESAEGSGSSFTVSIPVTGLT